MGIKWGDAALGALSGLLALAYLLVAVENPTPVLCTQAVLAVGFIPAFLFWRTRVLPAALALLALLAGWAVCFLVALPANTGIPPYLLAAPLVVYSTARYLNDRRVGAGVLLLCLAGSFLSPAMWVLRETDDLRYRSGTSFLTALVLHCFILGFAYLWALYRRHQEQHRAQEEEAAQAAARQHERMLIAQEIHDVLAHNLTLITVQSSAGIVASRSHPTAAVESLRTIREVGAEALAQVRGIVATLRNAHEPTAHPGTLAEAIEQFRSAGLVIEAEYPPDILAALPAQHALALHRISTEALTNALRHQGPGTAVDYRLVHEPQALLLTITSTGALKPSASGAGAGIVGMQERAEALDGELHAHPTPTGWRVSARIPLREVPHD